LPEALERLKSLLRIASVSTDPAYAEECVRAADWLATDLAGLGFSAGTRPTPGHPMVVGHADGPGRHLMFYGHYDVQPVDPVELWDRDPFDPELEDTPKGKVIRGRGAADDKGQLMTFIEACRAWKAVHGSLPAKISVFLEGEEESGSPSLIPFMEENRDELTADLALICDTGLYDERTPAITTMLRGLLGEEIVIRAADRDLHSGFYGSAAANPNHVVAKIVADLHDADGRVTLPGFYDGVPELPEELRAQWAGLDFDEKAFLGEIGLAAPAGEKGRSALEQVWSRPSGQVNGMGGGYQGEGFKTVIPSVASAKISFRLVFDQDPEKVRQSFRAFVRERTPSDCSVDFTAYGSSVATVFDVSAPAFQRTRSALTDEWGREAAFIGSGGSIPVTNEIVTKLGMPVVMAGFGLADDRIHSPNEKYDLRSFQKGVRSWAHILAALAP
jgi:acetylornithine deacetylase/succinyl-diaminopimelate desuccinylase-like protein